MTEAQIFAEQVVAAKKALSEKAELTGCTSYVQRKLQCGYNRAARILEALEVDRFISEPDQTGRRHLRAGRAALAERGEGV